MTSIDLSTDELAPDVCVQGREFELAGGVGWGCHHGSVSPLRRVARGGAQELDVIDTRLVAREVVWGTEPLDGLCQPFSERGGRRPAAVLPQSLGATDETEDLAARRTHARLVRDDARGGVHLTDELTREIADGNLPSRGELDHEADEARGVCLADKALGRVLHVDQVSRGAKVTELDLLVAGGELRDDRGDDRAG